MPELPEVETSRRGVEPLLKNHTVSKVSVRDSRLRQPVPQQLPQILKGQLLKQVKRRAKYLLFEFPHGHLLVHLGMSGSLRVVTPDTAYLPHDHVEIIFDHKHALRLRDPRRFGLVIWTSEDPAQHKLISHLGPEPLSPEFDGKRLHQLSRGRSGAVKNFIMNAAVVVGVGNIYASEALFRAGIHPARAAGRISLKRYEQLAADIKDVLHEAIAAGGTTLRDFVRNDGEPGYFRHDLKVYGRAGEACVGCGKAIRVRVIGQRSSFFCGGCQR